MFDLENYVDLYGATVFIWIEVDKTFNYLLLLSAGKGY